MGEGEVPLLDVDEEVGFLEEGATEDVVGWVGCAAEGEVVRPVWVDGVGCLQVECTVWQGDVDGMVCGGVADYESDGWVQVLQLLVDDVVDEI